LLRLLTPHRHRRDRLSASRPFWIITPSVDTLAEQRGWSRVGDDAYEAVRVHLYVRPREDAEHFDGRIVDSATLPEGTAHERSTTISVTESGSEQICEAVGVSVSERVAREITQRTKVTTDFNVAELAKGFLKGGAEHETQEKFAQELTRGLQQSLESTTTFTVTRQQTNVTSTKLTVGSQHSLQTVYWHHRLRRMKWDVFLCRIEYLRLRHTEPWYWFASREDVERADRVFDVPVPLCTVVQHIPVSELSVAYEGYQPQVLNESQPQVEPMTGPPLTAIPSQPTLAASPPASLKEVSREAFPTTRGERQLGSRRQEKKKLARGSGTGGPRASTGRRASTAKGGAKSASKTTRAAGGVKKAPPSANKRRDAGAGPSKPGGADKSPSKATSKSTSRPTSSTRGAPDKKPRGH
jgi:hypothetical protein